VIILFLALRNLLRNKRRFVLSLLMVIFTTLILIYSLTILDSIRNTARNSLVDTVTGNYLISHEQNPGNLFESGNGQAPGFLVKNNIMEIENILTQYYQNQNFYMSTRVSSVGVLVKEDSNYPVIFFGINVNQEKEVCPDISIDNLPVSSIITSSYIAGRFNLKQGDKITLMVGNRKIGIKALNFVFQDVFSPRVMHDSYLKNLVYINIDTAQLLCSAPEGSCTQIAIRVEGRFIEQSELSVIETLLPPDIPVKIVTYDQALPIIARIPVSASIMVFSQNLIFILLMLIALINLTAINIREQTKETSTLLALGMRGEQVVLFFIWQTLMLTILGFLTGGLLFFIAFAALSPVFAGGIPLPWEVLQMGYGGKILSVSLNIWDVVQGFLFFVFAAIFSVLLFTKKILNIRSIIAFKGQAL
jgi:ABC-type lipoprotein release transport system permease subunit